MKFRICMMLALMLIVPISAEAADNARAWLDRNTMQMGETVTLNVEVEGGSASQPDFSVLDSDFNTLGTQSSRQMSLVNGSASSKTVWAIGLEPRHAGSLTIPAFDIGSAKTQPLVLVVMPAATTRQGAAGDAIFITVDAQPLSPYVQQQIRLTVKLHFAVDLSEGALDEPAIDSAHVQKLGRDKQYATNLNGRRYQVLERNYAITPEHSGTLEIPGLNFRGSALDNTDPGSFFRRGRAVSARSEALSIEVRGRPASWGNAPWLPAQALSITDETTLPDEVALGEPLTRTVKLRAQGLGFEQLPELEMPSPAGADVYADKSETRTRDDGTWLYGERTRKFAVVASRPGTLVLPEMRVQWWDTTNDRMETAVLPEHSVRVVAAGTSSTPAGGQSSAADAISGSAAPAASTTPIIYPGAANAASAQRWRLLSFLFAGLWLATVLLWWRSRRKLRAQPQRMSVALAGGGRDAFLRACAMADLAEAERTLLGWARMHNPDLRNLGELALLLSDADQCQAIQSLQRVRYAGDSADGVASHLARAFRPGLAWIRPGKNVESASALPPLYPPSRKAG